MREITKTVSISIDGKPMDFRLTRLDAFSGAALLRMLSTMPEGENVANLFSWLSDMDFSSGVSERVSGGVSLPLSLDFSKAKADLNSFLRTAGKTIRLHADASAVVSAGRSALEQLKSLYESTTLTLNAEASTGDGATTAATGGRFTSPTLTQIAEDGDPEYVIPVKKESLAVPLLHHLIGELSDPAREALQGSLSGTAGEPVHELLQGSLVTQDSEDTSGEAPQRNAAGEIGEAAPAGALMHTILSKREDTVRELLQVSVTGGQAPPAGSSGGEMLAGLQELLAAAPAAAAPVITHNTSQKVSAPVSIQVTASGANPEAVGRSVYDVTEQYLLRTLKGALTR